jgi:hypothetical protein
MAKEMKNAINDQRQKPPRKLGERGALRRAFAAAIIEKEGTILPPFLSRTETVLGLA